MVISLRGTSQYFVPGININSILQALFITGVHNTAHSYLPGTRYYKMSMYGHTQGIRTGIMFVRLSRKHSWENVPDAHRHDGARFCAPTGVVINALLPLGAILERRHNPTYFCTSTRRTELSELNPGY